MSDIKLFRQSGSGVTEITSATMAFEKTLQNLFESNLDNLLGVRFLDSEYRITEGRIDTLGLDENNCPVIIEYKRNLNENVINQGLFYLDWLMNHKADFILLVQKKISNAADLIDWSAPRLICVAADFNRYDAHAVKQMNRNIELIRYRKFGDDLLLLDLLTATTGTIATTASNAKGRKQKHKAHDVIISEATGAHKERYEKLISFLHDLGDDVQELHLVEYVAFKRIKNFACVEMRNKKENILVYVKINPDEIKLMKGFSRDMRNIHHFGTGDVELTVTCDEDLERVKPLIVQSYEVS